MKHDDSSYSKGDEKGRSRTEDHEKAGFYPKTEEERRRQRRREWSIQQERLRQHERLRRKKILEFEIRYARSKGLLHPRGRCFHYSCSKSKSKSPDNHHRRTSEPNAPKTSIMSEKLEPSDGTIPLFKGPEVAGELRRDIVNPEDVVLKRRAGEGCKPIFEREEINGGANTTEEIVEHRTIMTVNNENLENTSKTAKKYTGSSSSVRSSSHSPRRISSRHSRCTDQKHGNGESYRTDRKRGRSEDRSRKYRESYKEKGRRQPHDVKEQHLRERKSRRDYSRSRERDFHHRSFSYDKSYGKYRERPGERSRDSSREHRLPPAHYIEPIPVPIYYGNFPPRPIMVGPLVPIRGQVPLGGNRHPMMGPLRPFPPRFISPDMYRLRAPPNPRFGPIY
ncbi:PREDICTED: arginine/serine-rich protein PNISR-like [Habropoda laboriosa]|uniref:arginine/serine-rich protein PNISR-like n=1 Tax=Habropoda laboriosa TaxID=597456 RepID=UPI00083D3F9B|nr:PREDICTED: arginine/serine-rich protein PNISR-like [Habropoda laboriosa]